MIDYNEKYFEQDGQVGDPFWVDGIDLYDQYNADLISFTVRPGVPESEYWVESGKSKFEQFGASIKPKQAEALFYVGGPSLESAFANVSALQTTLKNCTLYPSNVRYQYPAILTSFSSEPTNVEPYFFVTASFVVICRLPLVETEITEDSVLINAGNVPSGMRITITPESNMDSVTVAGITINNLSAHVPFIIDGIDGKVIAAGLNRFLDTDIVDFPMIQPGENRINTPKGVSVSIAFYPVFL